jgi:RNA polymerase sigma-70 factor (ECF subfamily)
MELLYRHFSSSVFGYARSIVREEHEAEDVTQQVFLKLMTSLGSFNESRGSFHGWLLRIARNAALDNLRHRRAVPAAEVFGADVAIIDTPSVITTTLSTVLADLPVRQRQVIVLLLLGLKPAEVAVMLELSEGAVHVLHHRARKRLCPELIRLGMAPSTTRRFERTDPTPAVTPLEAQHA